MHHETIEKLISHVNAEADKCYSDDFPIDEIEKWIRDFFHKLGRDHGVTK